MTVHTAEPEVEPAPGSSDAGPAAALSAVDRALAILCAFSSETPTLGVSQLSDRLALTKSTAHRLLQALVAWGLVMRSTTSHQYTLGYRVLALARAVPGEASLRHICQPHLAWLRAATEETAALYVAAGDVRICLEEAESPQMLRMEVGVGRCFSLERGAASYALLLDGPEHSSLWRATVPRLASDEQARIGAAVAAARAKGYALSLEETVAGAASIAAPIRGQDGRVLAALCVAFPAARGDDAAIRRYAASLHEAVARIAHDLSAAQLPQVPMVGS